MVAWRDAGVRPQQLLLQLPAARLLLLLLNLLLLLLLLRQRLHPRPSGATGRQRATQCRPLRRPLRARRWTTQAVGAGGESFRPS